ncbi:MAG: ATP-dependent zinc metalloprotease FtsH [candidate division WS6 bacterium GW2011_GWF2_39_15]|uniref:ATP-dependent zinc metalloprotease FtsH n=1 Tax=candidate division WS6 bacterium GW2011_GWF2_39_15 TaxID=1619100 RepID=A0A0G0MTD8_9BACT|nr:MAG: ATP-dependent zinc metalloprotease FtsH [candidate division WS6 bacterium GW2011_GWF2_39_15]
MVLIVDKMENPNSKKADIRKLPKNVVRVNMWGIVASIILSIAIFSAWSIVVNTQTKGREVSLSNVVNSIAKKDYKKIILKDNIVILEQQKTEKTDGKETKYLTRKFALIPPGTDFYSTLSDADVDIKTLSNDFYQPAVNVSITDIIWLILLALGLVLMYNLIKGMNSQGGRLMDFGQSKARMLFGKKTGITFDSVAGIEEVKDELVEIVDFLKSPKKYGDIGARIPKGVLLSGPPGTGKTLLAKAVAGEAGVPFFHTSGSEFEEMLVGAGASRVRDLFLKAKRSSPSIIFIDEIDAVAKKRGTVLHSGAGEQTLNQILVEMDGLEGRENVIVVAATNRPDVLDPAILRPGRFDRMVTLYLPDYHERLAILNVHAKNKKFDKEANLDIVARKTIGYSGADLENLLNEAAIMAVIDGRKEIMQKDLMESYLKVKLGRQKKNKRVEDDLKRVAYHEAGHAVVAKFTQSSSPVELVSMISRGGTGGVTVYVPEDDRSMETKKQLLAAIQNSVGGRVAEEIFLGDISSGASGDIRHATEVAKMMVRQWGMSDKLGFVQYGDAEETKHLGYTYGGGRDYSEKTAEVVDSEVKGIIQKAIENARKILRENKAVVEKLVELLLKQEEVGKEEFNALFE